MSGHERRDLASRIASAYTLAQASAANSSLYCPDETVHPRRFRMTVHAPPQRVEFSIEHLEGWAPGVQTSDEWRAWARGERQIELDGAPALLQMPAMLRRHAGRLGRMACDVSYRALREVSNVPMVYCSRYGEMGRSVDLLTALASDDGLSPTSFSLSVHNAMAGIYSMARHDTANCIALSAGDETVECGVLEACGLLAEGAERVLLVVADCPLPPLYASFEVGEPLALAWGCILMGRGRDGCCLEWSDAEPTSGMARHATASLPALTFLAGFESEVRHHTNGRLWRWHRHA